MIEIPLLKEGGGFCDPCVLTPRQQEVVHEAKIVDSQRANADRWRFRARRSSPLVGAVRLGRGDDSVLIRIMPKIDIARLMFLVEYARQGKSAEWNDQEVTAREEDGLVGAMAWAFERAASRALRPGVLTGYRSVERDELLVRGKIRIADQMRSRYTLGLPVALSYDDLTADIPENRLLLSAARKLRLLLDPRVKFGDELRHVEEQLGGVTPVDPADALPHWTPNRLNIRYRRALGLAELVLRDQSYELDKGCGVRTDGLLINMSMLYEDFVEVALERSLERHGGSCRLNKQHNLDRAGQIHMRPDLAYYRGSEPVAVADAKYIVSPRTAGLRDHLYQVVSYCAALNVRRGFLVYA
jgi:5-methylcytosine-specific restriction enzyme subunit McrC